MAATFTWLQLHQASLAMGSFITLHNAMIAGGMVQTADTGQLSMASPPAFVNTSGYNYGYTVYRFNDAAQATVPIFFRMDWKNQAWTTPSTFAHTVTIGTGSDGAGTITGVIQAATAWQYPSLQSTSNNPAWFTFAAGGDGSGFWMVYGHDYIDINNAQYYMPAGMLLMDRGRSANGVANASSVVFMWNVSSTYLTIRTYSPIAFPGQLGQSNVGAFIGWPWGTFSEASAGVVPAFPYTYLDPAPQTLKMPLSVNIGDYAPFQTFTVTHLGASHTYMAFTIPSSLSVSAIPGQQFAGNATMPHALALLFE